MNFVKNLLSRVGVKVFIFLIIVLGTFRLIGATVTDMTGGEPDHSAVGAVELSPEGGETIFWGKGRCYTCHSVGDRGSAVRGPNQGQFGEKFTSPIGVRSEERAAERSAKTGDDYTRTDYLIESLTEPGAYVVEGYKNEMAIVYAPPISLSLDEIKAVISYLQAQGGEFDPAALETPSELTESFFNRIRAASAAGGGDPGNGELVYEDYCSECHELNGDFTGGLGPNLTGVGSEGIKFLADSIVSPTSAFTEGFETWVLTTTADRQLTGLKTAENADEVQITRATGQVVTTPRADIKTLEQDELTSVMPNDLIEMLTVKDYQDLLSYLVMQKSEE